MARFSTTKKSTKSKKPSKSKRFTPKTGNGKGGKKRGPLV